MNRHWAWGLWQDAKAYKAGLGWFKASCCIRVRLFRGLGGIHGNTVASGCSTALLAMLKIIANGCAEQTRMQIASGVGICTRGSLYCIANGMTLQCVAVTTKIKWSSIIGKCFQQIPWNDSWYKLLLFLGKSEVECTFAIIWRIYWRNYFIIGG